MTVARTDPAVGVVSEGLEELLVFGQIFDGNPYLIFSPSFEGDSFSLKGRLRVLSKYRQDFHRLDLVVLLLLLSPEIPLTWKF